MLEVILHSMARVWREDTERLIYLLGGSTLVVHTTVCQLQPLSTTYLITQRVRQTFTSRGKVFTLLGCYVSLEDTITTEILASHDTIAADH